MNLKKIYGYILVEKEFYLILFFFLILYYSKWCKDLKLVFIFQYNNLKNDF